ncbi:MAG: flavodoxin-dependent (E)-4-hydroxy-3-methylbut-2-enyl-diphosphate synthase, partial [Bacteroidales bacterium]|nr:flavodoxin-dependent (E)-4-hydroxy-3-methylbut-2-enyl-diphosphate synthase [Bacteroidales bacterium]
MKYISFNLRNTHIGNHIRPIVVQSMCNCDTNDIESAVAQCREISAAGGTLVRLTTQGLKEVESLRVIKERLLSEGVNIPLVADVHFNSEVAIAAAKVADKVRINP